MATSLGVVTPTPILLWSASCVLKMRISDQYYGSHFTWCSPVFEGAALPRFSLGSLQPPSSDPVTIYRQLHAAVAGKDRHDAKIAGFKKSMRAIALKKRQSGEITDDMANEIVGRIRQADFSDWKPIMYVIPYSDVASRVQLVPLAKRASAEPEYVIPDLLSHEFHAIELTPCL